MRSVRAQRVVGVCMLLDQWCKEVISHRVGALMGGLDLLVQVSTSSID